MRCMSPLFYGRNMIGNDFFRFERFQHFKGEGKIQHMTYLCKLCWKQEVSNGENYKKCGAETKCKFSVQILKFLFSEVWN